VIYINFKLVHPEAKTPFKKRESDAAYDLYTPSSFDIGPFEQKTIDTGFICEIPKNYFALILDRSKLASQVGITVLGGVIDSGYRGTWGIVLFNSSSCSVHFESGQAIAQFIILPTYQLMFDYKEELSESDRGTDGIYDKDRR
jgi:dUTP pyrophosphatase